MATSPRRGSTATESVINARPVAEEDPQVGQAPRKPACTACTQRKVKCDRSEPCRACTRSRIECVYPLIANPARRKRKVDCTTQNLLDTIKSHEAKLRDAGLAFEPSSIAEDEVQNYRQNSLDRREQSIPSGHDSQALVPHPMAALNMVQDVVRHEETSQTQPLNRGLLVPEYGGRRYYEHGLIGALGKEYKQDLIDQSNQAALPPSPSSTMRNQQEQADIMASSVVAGPPSASPTYQYQRCEATIKHWLVFAENVHPLTKVLHLPTMQTVFLDSQAGETSSTAALKYSICACAVASLTDTSCQSLFGEGKRTSLQAFQTSANQALQASSFMRVPSLELLQAYLLHLTSMIHTTDPSTLWTLFGSALRLAQSQGLHRDGARLGLPPFETEMRRRLWWYIVAFDARLSELTGSESTLPESADASLPSNLNDSDIAPEMTTIPEPRLGATEMTLCLLKYETCKFIKDHRIQLCRCNPRLHADHSGGETKKGVADLEALLQDKILRFCDPVIPVQFLATLLARATICKLTQMTRHRRNRGSISGQDHLSGQSERTLKIATRNIEYDNLIHGSRSLRGFLWHVHFYFPWGAPVYVLRKLASQSDWDTDMEIAWMRIEEMFANHQEFTDDEKVMHLVLGNLALKAWETRGGATDDANIENGHQRMPAMIPQLQATQTSFWSRHVDAQKDAMSLFIPEGIWDQDMLQFQDLFSGQFDYFNAEPLSTGT